MAESGPHDIRRHAAERPDDIALVMSSTGERVTFAELDAAADRGARVFRAAGLGVGDPIAILMENRRRFLEIAFAADRAGLYYTAISTHLTPDDVAYIVENSGARMLIASDVFAGTVMALAPRLAGRTRILIAGNAPAGMRSWDAAVAAEPAEPIADEAQGLDMLYSSGTTGRPKGIKWPLPGGPPGGRTMLVDLLTGLFGYDADTRYLCPAPLYHAAPLRHTMVTLKMGGMAVVMGRFDAAETLRLIEAERITHAQFVPTMFVRMLKLPEAERRAHDLSSLTMAVHAAAPCPVEVKKAMLDWWGPIIHEYYAGTENNGFCAITPEEWLEHPGSVGRAKLGVPHICDEAGRELPAGSEGEIWFEAGHDFAYHDDPAKTAAARNDRGWTTLGDVGRLDPDGYLYLTDRKSFMIISGGVNVYPQEAENALLSHPAVLDAAVFGIPNDDFGEEVKAVVQTVPGRDGDAALEAELIAHCRARLAAIKCPRSVDFRDRLPREANGKLFKRALREEYVQAARREREGAQAGAG